MTLQFFCPRWGSEHLPWDHFMQKAKASGYDGIEYAIPNDTTNDTLDTVWNLAAKYNLSVIAQHYETGDAHYASHYDAFCGWFKKIIAYKPFTINTQTGKDFFTFYQNRSLIQLANNYGLHAGIPIVHETHRNKFSFAAHITKEFLQKMPSLKLTFDVSHWVCVAESFLDDQPEAMTLAIERAEHIHARVGHIQGPQITDPRLPEWQHVLFRHLQWWDAIIERKIEEGPGATLTITPEFGPEPYMATMPFTQQPLTDQWAVNEHMLNLLKNRYRPAL